MRLAGTTPPFFTFIVLLGAALVAQAQDNQGPARSLAGKFEVWKNQAVLHDVELLANGTYKMDDRRGKVIGQGTYSYDAKGGRVVWTGGPYKDSNYTGAFQVEHKIRVSNRAHAVNDKALDSGDAAPALGTYVARDAFIYFTLLPGGKYKTYNLVGQKLEGEGTYSFDPKEKAVKWLSGPNKERSFYTAFTVEQRIILDAKNNLRAERVLK